MLGPCEVVVTAGELRARLEARSIPDDYDLSCDYSEAIARVRDSFTNYRTLQRTLPGCPSDCPARSDYCDLIGPPCAQSDIAQETLGGEAWELAATLVRAWEIRQRKKSAPR